MQARVLESRGQSVIKRDPHLQLTLLRSANSHGWMPNQRHGFGDATSRNKSHLSKELWYHVTPYVGRARVSAPPLPTRSMP